MEIHPYPNKLRSYRRCAGYSQKKVSRMLALPDTSMLSRWEHGMGFPKLLQLFRLARIYNIYPHQLYDDLWQGVEPGESLLVQDNEPINS